MELKKIVFALCFVNLISGFNHFKKVGMATTSVVYGHLSYTISLEEQKNGLKDLEEKTIDILAKLRNMDNGENSYKFKNIENMWMIQFVT